MTTDLNDSLPDANQPQQVGRYRIVKFLGEGAAGRVYLAQDDQLQRPVAIKVPRPERISCPADAEAYLTEARTVAGLDHPNIVPIFDVGTTHDGLCYVVSKVIDGIDLAKRIRQGRFAYREATILVALVADALHYAHRKGVVHRDVKPANILLDASQQPYLTDFGLALKTEQYGKGLTFAGTPSYMSPEQARDEAHRVDGRSDIYSLGVVFYELLLGTRPFKADTLEELLDQVITVEPRPPRQVDDRIPKELERICLKAMSKRVSDRYTTARDMAEDLRSFLNSPQAATTPGGTAPTGDVQPSGSGGSMNPNVPETLAALIRLLEKRPEDRRASAAAADDVSVIEQSVDATHKLRRSKPVIAPARAKASGRRVRWLVVGAGLALAAAAVLVLLGAMPPFWPRWNDPSGRVAVPPPATPAPPPSAKAPFDNRQAEAHQLAWAKYLGVPLDRTNGLGMKLRLIPPGEFMMGVTDKEAEDYLKIGPAPDAQGGKLATPAHPVRLTRPFYLSVREVYLADFLDVMKREPGNLPRQLHNIPDNVLLANCTWLDCVEFCNRLSEREGLSPAYHLAGNATSVLPDATGYRLPTEAEWEFACRGGTTTLWYFGLTAAEARAACEKNLQQAQGTLLRPRVSGRNPFGLLGMYAGSSEWCWDWYDPGYYRECADRGVAVDPQGPDVGTDRVIRGGTYFAHAGGDFGTINSAVRMPSNPKEPQGMYGFGRIALPVAAPFGKKVNADEAFAAWLNYVATLPPDRQADAVAAKLKERNPAFDGNVTHQNTDGTVTELDLVVDQVTDVAPLRALPGLIHLKCRGSGWTKGQLRDLTPIQGMKLDQLSCWGTKVDSLSVLAGMKLTQLTCAGTQVSDLSPLRGMPLERLWCQECPGIKSLAPLKGMPLTVLDCSRSQVTDLSPLRGMKLRELAFTFAPVSDLSPLKGMPLTVLGCHTTPVSDLSPLKGMPLTYLHVRNTKVKDLSPLQGMPLETLHVDDTLVTDLSPLRGLPLKDLHCTFDARRDGPILRSIKTLATINDKPVAQFWKDVDAPR